MRLRRPRGWPSWFMVPMRAKSCVEPFHEPWVVERGYHGGSRRVERRCCGSILETRAPFGFGFMVPMRLPRPGSWPQCVQNLAWRISMNHRRSARFWTAPVLWRFNRALDMGSGPNIAFSFIAPPVKAAEGCRTPRRCRAGLAPVHAPNSRPISGGVPSP